MLILLFALQAAASAPDVELRAKVSARQLTIEKQGDARLTVTTSPDGGDNVVDIRAPDANGRKTLRNVNVTVRAEARIAQPGTARANNPAPAETRPPQ